MANFSSTYPSIRPVFNADFSNAGRLDPRITFSRSDTPPTYAAPSAVHYWSNEKHLSSENLILYSNGFDSGFSGTSTVRLGSTSGQSDPSGGTDASQLSQQAGQTSAGALYFSHSNLTVGQEYTWSIYVKNDGRTAPRLTENFSSGGSQRHTWFDTSSTGTVGTSDSDHTPLITKLGDWFRITIRFTADAASGAVYLYITSTDASATVADDGAGYYAYGASLSTTGQIVHENTSGQIARSYAPTLKSVSYAGQPRFEYSPTDSASMGLLVEGQATNLRANSEQFDNWTQDNVTVDVNSSIAPSGELTADKIRATGTGNHRIRQSVAITSGSKFTGSFYAKADGYTHIQVGSANLATWAARAFFNLSNGTVGTVTSGTAEIQDVGNGWYRCIVTGDGLATASVNIDVYTADGESTSFTANEYGGCLLWGAQVEQSSFASSYIATTSSTVTRAADSASAVMADIGYTGGPVSLVGEYDNDNSLTNRVLVQIYPGAGSTEKIDFYANSSNSRACHVATASQSSTLTFVSSANGKRAYRVDTNNLGASQNGGAVITDTGQVLPDLTGSTVHFGDDHNGGNSLNGTIKRIALYGEALSDTNLQALTS